MLYSKLCYNGPCYNEVVVYITAWASVQSDQGLHCPGTESLDTTEYMNREQRPGPSCSKLTTSLAKDSLNYID